MLCMSMDKRSDELKNKKESQVQGAKHKGFGKEYKASTLSKGKSVVFFPLFPCSLRIYASK